NSRAGARRLTCGRRTPVGGADAGVAPTSTTGGQGLASPVAYCMRDRWMIGCSPARPLAAQLAADVSEPCRMAIVAIVHDSHALHQRGTLVRRRATRGLWLEMLSTCPRGIVRSALHVGRREGGCQMASAT